jgi:hypothetical protein
MNDHAKPTVYISYTWLSEQDEEGKWVRVPDKRAFALAERLREAGFDSRLDVYFHGSYYGFTPPQRRPGDRRDPWIIWAEEQIRDADCVLMLCTPEYVASDPHSGECPGEWCNWHLLDDKLKFNEKGWPAMSGEKRPALWWDWHCIAKDVDAKPEKFIPVEFGPYNSQNVPAFVRGATSYNLNSTNEFEGLRRRIRGEHQKIQPRQGVFISYAHKDDQIWLDSLLSHSALLERRGVEIWTDREIKPGKKWHEEIQNSLARAKVAVLMVTPAFLESSYIASSELPNMLQAAESEGLVIFPIPVRPSSYEQSELAPFQAAHPLSEALSGLRPAKRDKAFVSIVSKLADALGIKKATGP